MIHSCQNILIKHQQALKNKDIPTSWSSGQDLSCKYDTNLLGNTEAPNLKIGEIFTQAKKYKDDGADGYWMLVVFPLFGYSVIQRNKF